MATMRDVAQLANVSVSTVSNYFNGTKTLKYDTQLRVEQAIKELHFQPNSMAKFLRSSQSNEIGVILPSLSDPYFSDIYRAVNNVFSSEDYFVTFAPSNEIEKRERQIVLSFIQKRVSGIIVATCQPHKAVFFQENCLAHNLPIVFLDRKPINLNVNYVHISNYNPIHSIVSALLAQGIRHIALLMGYSDFSSQNECFMAYKDAFAGADLSYDPAYIRHCRISRADAFDCSIKMLAKYPLEAILTSSETLMQGVRQAVFVRKLRAGEEILLISLGEESWCSNTSFTNIITTTRPANHLGETTARLLLQNIHAPFTFEPQTHILHDSFTFDQKISLLPYDVSHRHASNLKSLSVLLVDSHGISSSIEALLPNFECTYQCQVTIHTVAINNMLDEIISGGESAAVTYDVVMYDHPWLYYLASEHYLMDITDYVTQESALQQYLPNAQELYGKFDNHYFGVPFSFSPPLLFYRKDLFENPVLQKAYREKYQVTLCPPRTWTEFNTIAEFFTKECNPASPVEHGTALYGKTKEYIVPQFLFRLAAFGGSLFDADMNVTIRSDASKKAFLSLKNTMRCISMEDFGISMMDAIEKFLDKQIAMLICHASYAAEIVKKRSINTQSTVGYALIPGKQALLTGWGLGITSNSPHKELATSFIKWATKKDICEYRTILEGQSLSSVCHLNSELQESCPWLPLEKNAYDYCAPRMAAYSPGGSVVPRDIIEQQIDRALHAYLLEDMPLDDVLYELEHNLVSLFRVYGYSSTPPHKENY